MAAKSFRSAVVCAIVGHRWDWREHIGAVDDAPYRCERCRRYDDEPKIARAAKRRARFQRWSPLTAHISRRELSVRVGIPHHRRLPALSASVALRYGWERSSELPGIKATMHVWRLLTGLSIGGLWQDEDGDGRALFRVWADFTTYGWRWIGCWLGHKPETSEYMPNHVYCARCDESLTGERESLDVKVAA